MENQLTLLFAVMAGALIGGAVTWKIQRGQIGAAIEKGRSDAQVELATSKERLRSTEEELRQCELNQEKVQQQANRWRDELDVAHNEKAQLAERASRVPALESDLAKADDLQQAAQREILRLATSEAEKTQLLQSTKARLTEIEIEQSDTRRLLDSMTTACNDVSEKYAAMEVKASRIAPLEQHLVEKESILAALNREMASLKEETGRLQAQLKAEQDTLAATDIRHGALQQKSIDAEKSLLASRQQTADHGATIGRLEAELAAEKAALVTALEELAAEKTYCDLAKANVNRLTTDLAEITVHLDAERSQHTEKIELLTQAREQMSLEFKNLANEILEEKSKRFTEDNQANLGQLINPLKEKMTEFKSKVEEIHAKDIEQQAMLRSELTQLKDLNRQITEEAHGLATALKGQAKTQGNWGELVLGNVLDRAGLCDGKDFKREVSFNTEEGRKRPDVIVFLPQKKHLVIDAKVSLNAYTRYVNADDEISRAQALKEHVFAISSRIQELSDRTYFDLPGLNTPEMVFMFIPIESAFVEALRADDGLFQRAVANNILVATPTTLLTSLNIVRQLWRFEEQNAHTAELADRAAKVYKKLVSFLGSMEAVGMQLDRAKESYGKAMGQLVHGKGNLIQQANDFERLGVSIQAPIPEHLVATAILELDHMNALEDSMSIPAIAS
ncbi:MAG: recombination protein RmuC [Herminiimonas sp.]|nr:recombination protein RmuC [Herminiimonas sp.]